MALHVIVIAAQQLEKTHSKRPYFIGKAVNDSM